MRTRNGAPLWPGPALPPELIDHVLEYLPTQELWTTARASRQFYASAWRAGLVIDRYIHWNLDTRTISGVNVFKDVVAHALVKAAQIGLTFKSLSHSMSEPPDVESYYAQLQPSLDEIFGIITTALPLLVSLCVELPDRVLPRLFHALCHPAPRLRFFDVSHSYQDDGCLTSVPLDIFAHSSPQLRKLAVRTIALPDQPITAFRSVSFLHLEYENFFPHIKISRNFPHVTGLRLDFFAAVGAVHPERFDISGLALRCLIIYECDSTRMVDAVQRSIDLSAVPVLHVIGAGPIKWTEPIWTRNNDALSIRLEQWPLYDDGICVTVVPAHLQWRRLYRLTPWDLTKALPIRDLPNLSTRLTYLRIDSSLLCHFVELELTLTALRNLHIDLRDSELDCYMLAPPGYFARSGLTSFLTGSGSPRYCGICPCPALEEITLFALEEKIEGVDSRRAAFLALALGQLDRPRGEKTRLALVGVTFTRPVERMLLKETVSKITMYEFSGPGSCEDYDDGLWEAGV